MATVLTIIYRMNSGAHASSRIHYPDYDAHNWDAAVMKGRDLIRESYPTAVAAVLTWTNADDDTMSLSKDYQPHEFTKPQHKPKELLFGAAAEKAEKSGALRTLRDMQQLAATIQPLIDELQLREKSARDAGVQSFYGLAADLINQNVVIPANKKIQEILADNPQQPHPLLETPRTLENSRDTYSAVGVCTSHLRPGDIDALRMLAGSTNMVMERDTRFFVKLYDEEEHYDMASPDFEHSQYRLLSKECLQILIDALNAGYRMVEFDAGADYYDLYPEFEH